MPVTVECGYALCADFRSVVKLSLQSLVTVLILLFTCNAISRLMKPVTSRLYRLFSAPVVPGMYLFCC